MNEPDVMVYLMTGFLDSGKSQFLKFTLTQDYFQIDGTTLLILCEEGEEEFDPLEMAKHGVKIIKIEEQEELTEAFLNELHEKYSPERVVWYQRKHRKRCRHFWRELLPMGPGKMHISKDIPSAERQPPLRHCREVRISTFLPLSDLHRQRIRRYWEWW